MSLLLYLLYMIRLHFINVGPLFNCTWDIIHLTRELDKVSSYRVDGNTMKQSVVFYCSILTHNRYDPCKDVLLHDNRQTYTDESSHIMNNSWLDRYTAYVTHPNE